MESANNQPLQGDHWLHLRTEVLYTVCCNALSKRGDGEWEPCVVYQNAGGETFVRDIPMFINNFKRVD